MLWFIMYDVCGSPSRIRTTCVWAGTQATICHKQHHTITASLCGRREIKAIAGEKFGEMERLDFFFPQKKVDVMPQLRVHASEDKINSIPPRERRIHG
jgi:hypothetical protein